MRTTCGVVLALALHAQAFAQPGAALTPEQALGGRQISDLQLSPDCTRLAFVVTDPPKGQTRPRDIWTLDLATRQVRRLTYSAAGADTPRWSPDGRTLAFLSDRGGGVQIHLLPSDGGEAVKLTVGKQSIQGFDWAPDGRRIAFLAAEPRTDAEDKREQGRDDARVVDKDGRLARLWIVDRESKAVTQLTSGTWAAREVRWMPAGDRLAVVATDHPEVDLEAWRIFSVAAAGGELQPLAAPRGPISQLRVGPGGHAVAWTGAPADGPSAHDLWVAELGRGGPRDLTGTSVDRLVARFAWRPDGSFIVLTEDGFGSRFVRVDPEGRASIRPTPAMTVDAFAADDAGGLWIVGETAVDAPEIWFVPAGGPAQQATHLNAGWQRPPPGRPEIYRYRSFDGVEIEAALLRPVQAVAGSAPAGRLPLVVLVHGGPSGRWADTFEPWGQLLAARGYAVLYPNIRGSVGYGHRFVEMNRADWGGGDFRDVMAGVDDLVARGIADADRLGIGGWSYGGYMSAWAITQTTRFKAAVIGAGLSDLASEFGTENGSAYDEWYFGTPYERLDGFVKSSPITHIRHARTPCLILQGEADTTDPLGQSQQLYRGLKRYGVEADFVIYPREGHGLREEKHLLDRLNRIVAWYDTHLR
jgi:dipeptidyl aminopeptidase/acylaminoacyl peptidase